MYTASKGFNFKVQLKYDINAQKKIRTMVYFNNQAILDLTQGVQINNSEFNPGWM